MYGCYRTDCLAFGCQPLLTTNQNRKWADSVSDTVSWSQSVSNQSFVVVLVFFLRFYLKVSTVEGIVCVFFKYTYSWSKCKKNTVRIEGCMCAYGTGIAFLCTTVSTRNNSGMNNWPNFCFLLLSESVKEARLSEQLRFRLAQEKSALASRQ